MLEVIFADTMYLVALVDPRDSYAALAAILTEETNGRGVLWLTTDAVLIELGNYFANARLRAVTIDWIGAIRAHPGWEVVPLDPALLAAAEARYRRFDDKNWSLTDCISMEVMAARRLIDIATTDHGFTQAGFRALMA